MSLTISLEAFRYLAAWGSKVPFRHQMHPMYALGVRRGVMLLGISLQCVRSASRSGAQLMRVMSGIAMRFLYIRSQPAHLFLLLRGLNGFVALGHHMQAALTCSASFQAGRHLLVVLRGLPFPHKACVAIEGPRWRHHVLWFSVVPDDAAQDGPILCKDLIGLGAAPW